jgi:hypothetical protein
MDAIAKTESNSCQRHFRVINMDRVPFRLVSACFFILAGFLYGGFWMISALFSTDPDIKTNRRVDMASLGLVCMACSFWVAAFVYTPSVKKE